MKLLTTKSKGYYTQIKNVVLIKGNYPAILHRSEKSIK